jgi:spermidine synthase
MLIAPQLPRDVLGLAFGAGLSYRAARLFPEVQHLDFVDISRDNMLVALRQFPENAGLKDDPRALFIVDDAYSYVKYNRNKYGLILMEPTPPRFCYQTASLYTKEFYELARQRLTAGGLFTQVLSLRDFSPGETASVMKTFATVFPHRLLWRNGWDCLMIGSSDEFHLDLPTISERLNRPEVQKTLRASATIDKYYILDNLISGLLLAEDDFRRAAAGGTIYTDDNCGLKFASGRNITTENIRAIHEHLTTWLNIGRLFDRFPDFEKKQPVLAMKRQYFMAMMYQHVPREFDEVVRTYIKDYSQTKDEDLNGLRVYLLERGMDKKAEEVEDIIEDLGEARHGR